jgi:hypothetical protein
VLEKSDCAVVPVNQPNNEGNLPRRLGREWKGREQLKENIVHAHIFLTLSREMHVPAFGGVRDVDRSLGSLSRHPSFRRAVCVDGHVRICAGAISDGRPYRDRNYGLRLRGAQLAPWRLSRETSPPRCQFTKIDSRQYTEDHRLAQTHAGHVRSTCPQRRGGRRAPLLKLGQGWRPTLVSRNREPFKSTRCLR